MNNLLLINVLSSFDVLYSHIALDVHGICSCWLVPETFGSERSIISTPNSGSPLDEHESCTEDGRSTDECP
jgi:hypothetical protein